MPRKSRTWPPVQPISPEARVAGYTTSICFLVVGVAYSIIGFTSVSCTDSCLVEPGLAGMLLLLFLPITALATWGLLNVVHRTVDPGGFAAWRFGLSFVFFLGVCGMVARIPNATCAAGLHLVVDGLRYKCLTPDGLPREATSWAWLKDTIVLSSMAIGALLIPKREWIRFTWVISALVWVLGAVALAAPWFTESPGGIRLPLWGIHLGK